jgi:uncharacterized membrane protein YbaN (DUF454 family)
MALAALVWLSYQTWRLLWQPPPKGAIDLRLRLTETQALFAGQAVYRAIETASYPPASMAMLWPILSWPSLPTARWLWALLTTGALVWMVRTVVHDSGAASRAERRLAMLLPLATYATGAATGNGQFTVPVLACLLASLPILLREDRPLLLALAALGFVVALVKPSLAAPFFWMVLFRPKGPLPAIAIVAIYLGLTAVTGLVQPDGAVQLSLQFLSVTQDNSAWGAAHHGHANLHSWLAAVGRPAWNAPGSLLVLGLLGVWTWRHRRADPWLLMSAAAFAARFWTYHGWYDDLLLLVPAIALFRIAKQGTTDGQKVWAGSLLAAMVLSTLPPGGLYLLPPPWNRVYVGAQVVVWLTACAFLLRATKRPPVADGQRSASSAPQQ